MKLERLKRLVTVKARLRDAQKNAVAAAGQAVLVADQRVAAERRAQQAEVQRLTALGTHGAPEIETAADLVRMAAHRVASAQQARSAARARHEELREELAEASRDVKRVELLHGRLADRQAARMRRKEQEELDEIAARKSQGDV